MDHIQRVEAVALPGRQRVLRWHSLRDAAEDPDFLESSATRLSTLMFDTLPLYGDLASQRAVLATLRTALASETFLKTFAAMLLRADGAHVSRQETFILFLWSCALLQALQLPAGAKAAQKIMDRQVLYLDAQTWGQSRWKSIMAALSSTLQRAPSLLDGYIALARSTGSPGLVRALLEHLQRQPGQLAEHEAALLAVLIEKVLSSREAVPAGVLAAYRPLLAGLTPQGFGKTLLPALLRVVKRLPDAMLPCAEALLGMLTLDLSPHGAALMRDLEQQLRHQKESVRLGAVQCLRAAAGKVREAEALGAMFGAAEAALAGAGAAGKLRGTQERAAVNAAIGALAAGSPGRSAGKVELAARAAALLCRLYREEVNEAVKLEAVRALGAWAACMDALPADVTERFAAGLKEKEGLQRAHLQALLQALRSSHEVRASAGALQAPLAKLAADGSARAAQREAGLSAALALAYIAGAGADGGGQLLAGFWALLNAPAAPLLSVALLARLPPEEAHVCAELAQVLLLQHGHRLGEGATRDAARLLVAALLHYAAPVRRSARSSATSCVAESAPLAEPFIGALLGYLADAPSFAPAPMVQPAAPSEDGGLSSKEVSERFQQAQLAMAPLPNQAGASALPPRTAVAFLLAAHHPVITRPLSHRHSFWRALRRRLGSVGQALGSPEVVEHLVDVASSERSSGAERDAACAALGSALAENAAAVFPLLMPALVRLLDRAEHEALSPAQIKVFQTPADQIALEVDIHALGFGGPVANGGAPARKPAALPAPAAKQPALANGSARSGSGKGAAAGGKAGGQKGAGERRDPAQLKREQQLAEEALVRTEVAGIKRRLERGLAALTGAASGDRTFTAAHLDEFLEPVLPLLGSPLVGEGAGFEAVHALAQALPGALGAAGLDVVRALRLVELHSRGDAVEEEVVQREPVVASIGALTSALQDGQPLPTPLYMMLFPVLRAVLSWRRPSALHEPALAAVALHVSPETEGLPRPATLALLYHVLETLPGYRDKVQPLLEQLCRGLPAEQLPAALQGLTASSAQTRAAALAALPHVPCLAQGDYPRGMDAEALVWIACFDIDAGNAAAAQQLYATAGMRLPPGFLSPIIAALSHRHADVRAAAAAALAAAMQEHPEATSEAVGRVIAGYSARAPAAARSGAALALRACTPRLGPQQVPAALDFLLAAGLGDPDDEVRAQMVAAGMAIVAEHGASNTAAMLAQLEGCLEAADVADEAAYDRVREGVVVFLGTLARHLEPSDPKVRSVLGTLIDVLRTPSSDVQRSVADCLGPLAAGLAADRPYLESLIARVLDMLTKGGSYGDRKGAAFGLAGIVKGLGVSSVNGYGILDALKGALDDQGSADAREGALFALEALCEKLGRWELP